MSTEAATNSVEDDVLSSSPGVADEADAQGDDQLQSTEEAGDGEAEDDSEEIDYEGKKYKLPKGLKPALLMQQDYTKKTQEVADHRRAVEAAQAAIAQERETVAALRQEYGRVEALNAQVAQYETIDWAKWFEDDYAGAQAASVRYQTTIREADKANRELADKEAQRLDETRTAVSRAAEEAARVLKDTIPDWSPTKAATLQSIAMEYGYPAEAFATFTDPRAATLLNDVAKLRAENASLKSKHAAVKKLEGDQQVTPAAKVKGTFAPAGLHDNLPADEWLRRRNAMAKRG